ncbi:hypothetical protein EHE19_016420 [Ruminiclostridium herbifermentans]|uniref:Peptidase S8/S53 domain-containing protein n=1 Tax=Ruminiclostridium herbifermentans TaxID=2488810 RepID=A0A4U7J5V8_9FIRM|nr:S8 family serine peptidase [Ruminiclostridium herbifermentans]QNU66429.1 hypothetical protein EHE19_016420 [Ruminiclostridium herbifermentans]
MLRVAVIDNGISEKYIKGKISHYKIEKKAVVIEKGNPTESLTHGTICAYIISKLLERVELIDINVFGTRYGSSEDVILALEWCLTHAVTVINMSFGTVDYREYSKMEGIIHKLSMENRYLVAAFNNFFIKSYPASVERVFGVRADKGNLRRNGDYSFAPNRGLQKENTLVAHWDLQEYQEDLGQNEFPHRSNSFSAPVITAFIARCLGEYPGIKFNGVIKYLEQNAVNEPCEAYSIDRIFTKLNFSIEIPVIAFVSEDIECTRNLQQLLDQEGYEAVLVTDGEEKIKGIPLNIYCDIEEELTKEIIASIAHIYQADILIMSLCEHRFHPKNQDFIDIIVRREIERYRVEFRHNSCYCDTIWELSEMVQQYFQ